MFDFDVLGISDLEEPRSNDVFTLGAVHLGAPVGEVSRGPLLTLAPEISLGGAAEALRRARRTSAIVTRQQRPLGVVTSHDLFSHLDRAGDGREPSIVTVMTACLEPLRPADTVGTALRRMCSARIWHLPLVCERGLVVGALDLTDLTLWLRDRMTLLSLDAAFGSDVA